MIIDISPSVPAWCSRILFILLACFLRATYAQGTLGGGSLAWSGSYRLLQCGFGGQPGSQASIVQDILATVRRKTEVVLVDAKLGSSSTHGFTSFFKSDSNKNVIQDVFSKILDGPVVTVSPQRAQNIHRATAFPTIVCANEGDPSTEWMYNSLCQEQTHTAAGQRPGTELVVLCPLFFRLGQMGYAEPSSGFCPILIDNKLSPNSEALTLNQLSAMVHELTHLYGPVNQPNMESYRIQDAIDLNATASLENASNFVFYFAAIVAGCTAFPPKSNIKDDLRSRSFRRLHG